MDVPEARRFAGVVNRRACGREGVCCRVGRIEAGDVAGCEQVAEAVVSGAGRAEGVKWMVVGDEEKELGGKCAKGRHAGVSEAVVFGPRLEERKTKW
jgi:hypothetical protein